jgi:glycosyltransferase involved in cell wall biosynthesis
LWKKVRPLLVEWRFRSFRTDNDTAHSISWPNTGLLKELNRSDADIIHLHWLGNTTLSVEEIGRLQKPVVWTLHDQWVFSGAEHYGPLPPLQNNRPVEGYYRSNRSAGDRGPDLCRWTWERKRRIWRKPIHLVVTSKWLEESAVDSALVGRWPLQRIPYPLDLRQWNPVPKAAARQALGLPLEVPLILFGAYAGLRDRRKGGDLLIEALKQLRQLPSGHPASRVELVTFGPAEKIGELCVDQLPIHQFGSLGDTLALRILYSAATLMAVPSRLEAYGQTASEAQACGTPVVGFANTGVADVIEQHVTGALAPEITAESLAYTLAEVLNQEPRQLRAMGLAARKRAEVLWQPEHIARRYCELYREIVATQNP